MDPRLEAALAYRHNRRAMVWTHRVVGALLLLIALAALLVLWSAKAQASASDDIGGHLDAARRAVSDRAFAVRPELARDVTLSNSTYYFKPPYHDVVPPPSGWRKEEKRDPFGNPYWVYIVEAPGVYLIPADPPTSEEDVNLNPGDRIIEDGSVAIVERA